MSMGNTNASGSAFGSSFRSMLRSMYLRMFLPSIISSLALAVSNVADALVVGNRIGEAGLATIGLATPVYLAYSLLGTGFSRGGGVTHSRLTAAEARDRALCHCRRIFRGLLTAGVMIAVFGNLFLGTLLDVLGAGQNVPMLRMLCKEYLQPIITTAPLFFLNFLLYFFVHSDDNPRLASLGFTVCSILDLALNILFVLILHWGVKGAAWATIIAQAVSVLILSTHLFIGKKGILRLKAILAARAPAKEVRASCAASLRIVFSSSMAYLFQFLFMLLGNHLLIAAGARGAMDGELAVAVFDLVMNISFVTVSVYQASSEAMQPLAATFAVEHDSQSLQYVLQAALYSGLLLGLVLSGLLAVFAGPVAALFGITTPAGQAMAIPAVRIFLLSTPFSGILVVLVSYDQSTDRVRTAALATLLRSAVFLLPVTLLLGLFWPEGFWWLFLAAEGLTLAVMVPLQRYRRKKEKGGRIPVLTCTMTNDNRELGAILEEVEAFCADDEVPPGTGMQMQLAVEELCAVTMAQAFSGKDGEYIRITLAAEPGPKYVLHIRNSAPYFNPLDMKMEQARKDMTSEVMDSIGVMMVRKKAKSLSFRNYQGYNVLTVEY